MKALLRRANRDDVAGMQRVRASVLGNRLTSTTISDQNYVHAIEVDGRGWVIELESEVVAFAVGDATSGNIWALFVHPAHERRGYGWRLHNTMIEWLWSRQLNRLWLTTEPGTRAQRFYETAGWQQVGVTESGEVRYELRRS